MTAPGDPLHDGKRPKKLRKRFQERPTGSKGPPPGGPKTAPRRPLQGPRPSHTPKKAPERPKRVPESPKELRKDPRTGRRVLHTPLHIGDPRLAAKRP